LWYFNNFKWTIYDKKWKENIEQNMRIKTTANIGNHSQLRIVIR